MFNPEKYDGHTAGPWTWGKNDEWLWSDAANTFVLRAQGSYQPDEAWVCVDNDADREVIKDSPALLRAVAAAMKLEDELTIMEAVHGTNRIFRAMDKARAELRARLEEVPG